MAIFIDRSKDYGEDRVDINRQRFLDKHKKNIQKYIKDTLDSRDGSIEHTVRANEDWVIGVDELYDDLQEHYPVYKQGSGDTVLYISQNPRYKRGDEIHINNQHADPQSGHGTGEGDNDELEEIVLSKPEFIKILFDNLDLPNFIKKNLTSDLEHVYQRCGYSKTGSPHRLDLLKTITQSIIRRIACKDQDPPYLIEEDMRYKFYDKRPHLVKKAHVYFALDTSGSMDKEMINMARRMFFMIFTFLHEKYKNITLTFIQFTDSAQIVTEDEFFERHRGGATSLFAPAELMLDDIKKNHADERENIYSFMISDGDLWEGDLSKYASLLTTDLLPKLQLHAYLQVATGEYHTAAMGKTLGWHLQNAKYFSNLRSELLNGDLVKSFVKIFKKR